jgi:glutamate N-acetyltransferase / amino-acid N-acetyltransferase
MNEHTLPLGFRFAGVAAGIKKTGADDMAVVVSDRPCSAAGTFTQNLFPAAPVLFDKALLQNHADALQAVVINAGVANACTGELGLLDAEEMARSCEHSLGLPSSSVAVMSTGVIGPRLPLAKIVHGIELASVELSSDGWGKAAHAIMTTDTRPKTVFREIGPARLFGMAKGAGMIHPNMATMLCLIVTDAVVAPDVLQRLLSRAVAASFNNAIVDGDTSTNDTVLVLANGAAGPVPEELLASALTDACTDLAKQVVRDGEGATKFITIAVRGAASQADAKLVAQAVAKSPLTKTAFYGGDANWGRIICATGYAGAKVEPASTSLAIAGTDGATLQLVIGGQPVSYSEEIATGIFAGTDITISIDLGLGNGTNTTWTCDLSHAYVDINGHYRT